MSERKQNGKPCFDSCIQCGFCLEVCPTYRETFQESFAPRGRVILGRAIAGTESISAAAATAPLEKCLMCGACEAACPSGVTYTADLARLRDEQAAVWGRKYPGWLKFYMEQVVMHPGLLKFTMSVVKSAVKTGLASLWIALFFPKRHRRHFSRLVASIKQYRPGKYEGVNRKSTPSAASDDGQSGATGEGSVNIFHGCVTPSLFPGVIDAWRSLLHGRSIPFRQPRHQGCCGALHYHHGDLTRARQLARKNIDAFKETSGPILVEAAGCGAMLKRYAELLADDEDYKEGATRFAARIQDATEHLADLIAPAADPASGTGAAAKPIAADGSGARIRLTFQEPCHLRNLQPGGTTAARRLLSIIGAEEHPVPETELCCGSAGIYNLLEPELAAELGERKADQLASSIAPLVVTTNPGCRIQLAGRLTERGVAMEHLLETVAGHYPAEGESTK